MPIRIYWTQQAQGDLRAIRSHIVATLQQPRPLTSVVFGNQLAGYESFLSQGRWYPNLDEKKFEKYCRATTV
jgi:hypothetical protein